MSKEEAAVTKAVIEQVNASGLAVVWRNQAGVVRVRGGFMHMAPEGSPDVVGFLRTGVFVGIETKFANNKTAKGRAAKQEEWRCRIVAAGGCAGQARNAAEALALVRVALGLEAA